MGNINPAGNTINTSPLNEGGANWGTDSDLENALALAGTIHATAIKFDFNAVANQIQFNYLLASEECLGTNPRSYSDGFAFSIREASMWSTGDISSDVEITEIGTYSITVTSEYGCQTMSVFNVTESEAATIDFAETIDFSDPNNITMTISKIGNYLYQLDTNPPQVSNVYKNVTLRYHRITIIDLNDCAEVTKEVVVIDTPKIFIPNGDGYFDTWHIEGVETLPGTVIYIFDRYGKLLTTLTYDSLGWNGIYNDNQMSANDY
mgnify:CR=1 FL=1